MSKQLTFSATLSMLALAVLALFMSLGGTDSGSGARAATAHGSIVSVLLRT